MIHHPLLPLTINAVVYSFKNILGLTYQPVDILCTATLRLGKGEGANQVTLHAHVLTGGKRLVFN